MIATNQTQLLQSNQQIHRQVKPAHIFNVNRNQIFSPTQPRKSNHRSDVARSSEDDLDVSNEESLRKHQWQRVNNKRRGICPQTSAEIAEQIQTTNRFESLSKPPCDRSQNGTSTNLKTPIPQKGNPSHHPFTFAV
jgi:RNA polymerase-binding transcription factor DksA